MRCLSSSLRQSFLFLYSCSLFLTLVVLLHTSLLFSSFMSLSLSLFLFLFLSPSPSLKKYCISVWLFSLLLFSISVLAPIITPSRLFQEKEFIFCLHYTLHVICFSARNAMKRLIYVSLLLAVDIFRSL